MQPFNFEPRILLGPGPSNVHPRVLAAMAKHTIGHLDPQFIVMMNEIKQMLRYAFQTENELTMPVSAPGSAGMETCFVNLIEPGDKVIVCINGVFGNRMKENVERFGGVCETVEQPWGEAIDTRKVASALKNNPDAKVLAFVHAETSTGAQSDAKALCQLAAENECLTIVDAVTSLAGSELKVDEWGIDAIYSGSQKCLSCTPGLSPISLNDKAIQVIRNRKTKVSSWFLDLNLVMAYWGESKQEPCTPRSYHHTAPINALYGLHEALVLLVEEGLENSHKRHKDNHLLLKNQLEALGINFVVEEKSRLPQLNSVWIPSGLDDATVRSELLNQHNLEIGAGLGDFAGKIWRIGLMGHSSTVDNVMLCVDLLKQVIKSG